MKSKKLKLSGSDNKIFMKKSNYNLVEKRIKYEYMLTDNCTIFDEAFNLRYS